MLVLPGFPIGDDNIFGTTRGLFFGLLGNYLGTAWGVHAANLEDPWDYLRGVLSTTWGYLGDYFGTVRFLNLLLRELAVYTVQAFSGDLG